MTPFRSDLPMCAVVKMLNLSQMISACPETRLGWNVCGDGWVSV